jgi:hypothetical protein
VSGDQARDGLEPCPRDDLVERLREPDMHDQQCPFRTHCYCSDSAPHDNVQDDLRLEAAKRIEADQSSLNTMAGRIEALEEALAEAREALLCANQNYSAQRVDAALRGEQP